MTPSEIHKRQELEKLLFVLENEPENQNVINRVSELREQLGIEPDAEETTEAE